MLIMLLFYCIKFSLNIENVRTNNILVGFDDHDLPMSCKAIGGKPAPTVLIIDG